jgi:hypothetical protein
MDDRGRGYTLQWTRGQEVEIGRPIIDLFFPDENISAEIYHVLQIIRPNISPYYPKRIPIILSVPS